MDAVQRKGRLALVAVVSFGVTLALVVLLTAASPRNIDGIAPVFLAALAFNALSLIARWILTKNRRPIFLLGRFPFVVGIAKLSGAVACVTLIVALVPGLVAGPPFGAITLRALVMGLVIFASLTCISGGILNVIVVTRHFRGTLATTSRQQLP